MRVQIVKYRGGFEAEFGAGALRRSRRVSGLSPAGNNLVPEGGMKRLFFDRQAVRRIGRCEPHARAIHAKSRPHCPASSRQRTYPAHPHRCARNSPTFGVMALANCRRSEWRVAAGCAVVPANPLDCSRPKQDSEPRFSCPCPRPIPNLASGSPSTCTLTMPS